MPTLRGCEERRERRRSCRVALDSISSNLWTETGVDLGAEGAYCDAGDLKFTLRSRLQHRTKVGELLDEVCVRLSGGDHSITLPIVFALRQARSRTDHLHFDAHPDLYDELEGNRLSHACPFARIMEEGAAKRLIQIGIRTMTGHQREQAQKFGVEVIEMRQLPVLDRMKVDGPIYISFDLDALDPAFAPGISHREPGGMSTREAIAHIHAITGKIAGADIVEFNPAQDTTQITATVAAKLMKEILGKMIG